MMWSRRLLFAIVCLLAIGMDGLGQRRTIAAGPSSATVSILRNPKLAGVMRTGDFNRDGILDVVATAPQTAGAPGEPKVVIALGNGGGSLATPVATSFSGHVEDVDDVNGDGKLDLLIGANDRASGTTSLFYLLGNGDGTFTTVRPVGDFAEIAFAKSVDLDGDGFKDILLAAGQDIEVVTGNAAGTYPGRTSIATASDPRAVAIGDFDHDGRLDFAVTNFGFNSMTIFHNQGALAFGAADITITPGFLGGVAAADLNGDGKIDLVVAVAGGGDSGTHWTEGRATVLLGNGDGTFRAPISYDVAPGAWEVVVGDFTRDGIVDIATANRSSIYYDALCEVLQSWDSVSVLPGKGDGTFAAPSHFSIGNQLKSTDPVTDRNTVVSLAAGDLNGDHNPDLIVSNGTLFINRAADPNWAPTVDAGPDQTVNDPGDHFVHLYAKASDVDQDMLTYAWYDSTGDFVPQVPSPCFSPHVLGVHTYTVVVDDGHGHTASDSVQVDFGSSGGTVTPPTVTVDEPAPGDALAANQPFTIRWTATAGSAPISRFDLSYSTDNGATNNSIVECRGLAASSRSCEWQHPPATEQAWITVSALADDGGYTDATSGRFAIRSSTTTLSGWSHGDVGAVGAAGNATYQGLVGNGEGLTLTGSGADIWGTADEFHFAWKHMTGNFSIDTYVESLQNTNAWAKAGLMIRASALDASSPHASIVVSPSRGIAFQRRTAEGGSSASTQGPALTAPLYLRLTRVGSMVRAYYRKRATDAWTNLQTQVIDSLSGGVDVGMAVTSHADPTLATAKFTGVYLAPIEDMALSSFGGALGGWGGQDTQYNFSGSGSDIWGTSDSFIFASVPIGAYHQVTVRVRSIGNTNAWAKAGVMIRESLDANAKHADAIVSPSKGIAMQYRSATGGASASAVELGGAAPIWLRIRRFDSSTPDGASGFSTWYSTDFTIWRRLGDVNFNMAHDARIGIAVTSHKAGTETPVVIDDVRFER